MEDEWQGGLSSVTTVIFPCLGVTYAATTLAVAVVLQNYSEEEVLRQREGIKPRLLETVIVLSLLLCISGFFPVDSKLLDKVLFGIYAGTLTFAVAKSRRPLTVLLDDPLSIAFFVFVGGGLLSNRVSLKVSTLAVAGSKACLGGLGFLQNLHELVRHNIRVGNTERRARWVDLDPAGLLILYCREFSVWLAFILWVSSFVPPGLTTLLCTSFCTCGFYGVFLAFFWDVNTKEQVPCFEDERFGLILCSSLGFYWCLVSCFCQLHGLYSTNLQTPTSTLLSIAMYINFTLGMGSTYFVRLLLKSIRIDYTVVIALVVCDVFSLSRLYVDLAFETFFSIKAPPRHIILAVSCYTSSLALYLIFRKFQYRLARGTVMLFMCALNLAMASLSLCCEARLRRSEGLYTTEEHVAHTLSYMCVQVRVFLLFGGEYIAAVTPKQFRLRQR